MITIQTTRKINSNRVRKPHLGLHSKDVIKQRAHMKKNYLLPEAKQRNSAEGASKYLSPIFVKNSPTKPPHHHQQLLPNRTHARTPKESKRDTIHLSKNSPKPHTPTPIYAPILSDQRENTIPSPAISPSNAILQDGNPKLPCRPRNRPKLS